MTQISRDDVLKLARLSSIALTDEEIDSLQNDLPKIVAYINQLNDLDTEGVEPTFQVNHRQNAWREDEVLHSVDSTKLLSLAPSQRDDQIEIAKVL